MIKVKHPYGVVTLVLLSALPMLLWQCGKTVPEGTIPVTLEQNTQFKHYAMYQFDDNGVVRGNSVHYWIHLPENNPSLIHARVISKEGNVHLDFSGPGISDRNCENITDSGIFACAIDLKDIPEGDYFFKIRSSSGEAEKYNFFVSYRSKSPF